MKKCNRQEEFRRRFPPWSSFQTIDGMNILQKHHTSERMEWFEGRRREVGEECIREVKAECTRPIAEVDQGTDPLNEPVRPRSPGAGGG